MSSVSRQFDFQPVVIIAAARSGTNMLRDMLTKLPGVTTWPGDETNYLWQQGHVDTPHDVLTAADATPRTGNRVRRAFARLARAADSKWVVEKTCANSLRVEYIHKILPKAKFIFLVRDGRDVTLSAEKCWLGKRDPTMLLRRSAQLPLRDLPSYGFRFVCRRARRLLGRTSSRTTWGPRVIGLDELVRTRPLDEVCALQWQRSVETAQTMLSQLPTECVHKVRYEDVVLDPEPALAEVMRFLQMDFPASARTQAVAGVFSGSAGRWRREMSAEQQHRIGRLLGPTLAPFGYETISAAGVGHAA